MRAGELPAVVDEPLGKLLQQREVHHRAKYRPAKSRSNAKPDWDQADTRDGTIPKEVREDDKEPASCYVSSTYGTRTAHVFFTVKEQGSGPRFRRMLRPRSWTKPAGVSPVRVVAGGPGGRPRFVVVRWRAERGVESLFGGSKHVSRSATRRESCSLVTVAMGGAEPLMSR
jgi:hypothetical protein